jgi:hypothetical protein
MSLSKDITEIKKVFEADEPIFKPASPENIGKRKEERERELAKQPIIPVDQEAYDLDVKAWESLNKLKRRIEYLRAHYNVDQCKCSWERIELAGEDIEQCDIPGESGCADRYCLRCGGWVDTTY